MGCSLSIAHIPTPQRISPDFRPCISSNTSKHTNPGSLPSITSVAGVGVSHSRSSVDCAATPGVSRRHVRTGEVEAQHQTQTTASSSDAWLKEEEDEFETPSAAFFWHTEDGPSFDADWVQHKVVGKGQFGTVHIVTHRVTGQRAAAKQLNKGKTKRSVFENEVECMRLVRGHPGNVHLHGVHEGGTFAHLLMEYLPGGELFDRLVSVGAYSEKAAREPIRCAVEAVAYMHSLRIVHRDLKPENLLLISKECGDGRLKVADFGLAKMLPPGAPLLTAVCGTWAYSAPEMRDVKKRGYDFGVDVWALGVIMYVVLVGFHPFDCDGTANQGSILDAIQQGKFDFQDAAWTGISDHAKDLIRGMLRVDPAQRLTAAEALAHPWMRNAYLSAEPLSPNIGSAIDAYRKRMATKMKATGIVAIASVAMLQVATGRRWSAPVIPAASAVLTAGDPPLPVSARPPGIQVAAEPSSPQPSLHGRRHSTNFVQRENVQSEPLNPSG